MTSMVGLIALATEVASSESYGDLLRSGPHWLFELTLEALSAPLAFAFGWLWRNHVLNHVHRDLRTITGGVPEAKKPTCPAVDRGRPVPGGLARARNTRARVHCSNDQVR
jgi:hypothetical protein